MPDHGRYPLAKGTLVTQEEVAGYDLRDLGDSYLKEVELRAISRLRRELSVCAKCPSCKMNREEVLNDHRDTLAIRFAAKCTNFHICPGIAEMASREASRKRGELESDDLEAEIDEVRIPASVEETPDHALDALRFSRPKKTDRPMEDGVAGSW